MLKNGADEIERSLRALALKPAPPGLRHRVLDSAVKARKNAPLTAGMRIAAAVCSALIVGALGIDRHLEIREAARLTALVGGPEAATPAGQDPFDSLWAELGLDWGDVEKPWRREMTLSRLRDRTGSRPALSEIRELVKGMIDHDDPENPH